MKTYESQDQQTLEIQIQIKVLLNNIVKLEAEITGKKRGYKYCSYFPHIILGRNVFALLGGNKHPLEARWLTFIINHLIWHRLLLSTMRYCTEGIFGLPTFFIVLDLYWIGLSYLFSQKLVAQHIEQLQKVSELKKDYQSLQELLKKIVNEKLDIDLDIGNENLPKGPGLMLDKIKREEILTKPIPLKKYEENNDMTWDQRWLNLQPSALTELFYSNSDTAPKLS